MQIDRARYLELVFAMGAAASACTTQEPTVAPVVVPVQPPQPVAPVAAAPPPRELGAPAADASTSVAIASDGPRSGRPSVATYSGPLAKTCASLKCPLPAPWQESFLILKNDCRQLERGLKKPEFERFVGCLLAQNNTRQTCDLTLVDEAHGCLAGWAQPDTIDPATEAKCKTIVPTCQKKFAPAHSHAKTPLTMEVCQGLLSVVMPGAERKMISCITEYCEDGPRLCYMAFDRK